MKPKHCLIGLMALAFTALPAIAETLSQPMQPLPPQQLAASNNTFAYDLYAQLKNKEGNLFFSPVSVSAALAMTYAGAKGDTSTQMQKVLRFPVSQSDTHTRFAALLKHFDHVRGGGVQLDMANSLWPQQGAALLNDYLALVKKNYGVAITPVDYKHAASTARNQINRWVESKTRGKIKNPIGNLGDDTRLVLVNAAYFKGDWADPFQHSMTEDAPFFAVDGTTPQVPLMTQTEFMSYAAPNGVQLVKLGYKGDQLSMLVILPADKTAAGLRKLENELTARQVAKWEAQIDFIKVELFLPAFKFDWGAASLKTALQALGMDDAFQRDKADFSGMNGLKAKNGDAEGLYISDVVHKAFIAVDERGTEAAAATGTVMVAVGAAPSLREAPPVFRADHPFLFLIQDNDTGSILFMGRVMNPAAQ